MKITKILLFCLVIWVKLFTPQVQAQVADTLSAQPPSNDSLIVSVKPDSILVDSMNWVSKDAIESVINYTANDSFPIFMQGNLMTLYGGAKVTYENITLEADIIIIDWDRNTVFAKGRTDSSGKYTGAPVFQDGETEYKAKRMAYNFKTKKAKIYDLITQEGENYIHAAEVKKDENNVLYGRKAKFTTCDHEDPHFYIAATKIKILKNKVITGPAYLTVEGIPVPLAVPFGFFPKQDKRSHGIVMPAYGESTDRGFYLRGLGYYFPVNEYMDLLIKGDIYSRGSWMINTSTNYVKRYKYKGNLNIQYAHNRFGDPNTPDFTLDKDFSITWSHNQDPKARPNSNFSARVNAGSRNSFRNNYNNPNEILQNNLSSSVSYSKRFSGTPFSMTSSVTHSQNLSTGKISLAAPNVSVNMKRITPFKKIKGVQKKKWYSDIGFNYSMNMRNSLSTVDSAFLDPATWKEWQNGIQHNLPFSTSFKILKYITFSPSINYTGRTYFERTRKVFVEAADTTESDTIIEQVEQGVYQLNDFSASANLSTRLYGMFNINKFGIIAIRHQMTPALSFSYHPDMSDPRFGVYDSVQLDNTGQEYQTYSLFQGAIFGFPGGNRQGNINFNVQNNIEAKIKSKKDTTGENTEKIKLLDNFSFSGRYNIFADSMNLSTIAFSGRTNLFKNKFNIQFSGELDPYDITSDSFRIDQIALFQGHKPARMTRAAVTINTSLNSPKGTKKGDEHIGYGGLPYDNYVDFDIPWNLSLNYSLTYSNFYTVSGGMITDNPVFNQTLNFNGNMNLTPNWKINFSSGYDLKASKFTFTSIDLYRNLHCWEMSFSWIPFGSRQQYMFKLNVKSATLKDLKIDKKKYYYDY